VNRFTPHSDGVNYFMDLYAIALIIMAHEQQSKGHALAD
jgi:hypothetical protein